MPTVSTKYVSVTADTLVIHSQNARKLHTKCISHRILVQWVAVVEVEALTILIATGVQNQVEALPVEVVKYITHLPIGQNSQEVDQQQVRLNHITLPVIGANNLEQAQAQTQEQQAEEELTQAQDLTQAHTGKNNPDPEVKVTVHTEAAKLVLEVLTTLLLTGRAMMQAQVEAMLPVVAVATVMVEVMVEQEAAEVMNTIHSNICPGQIIKKIFGF